MGNGIGGNGGVGPDAANESAGSGPPTPPPEGKRPLGTVIASAVDGVRTLVRKHVELARIEITEAAGVRAKGVGMMAAAGVFGVFAVAFLAASASAALDLVLPRWAANLIVAIVFVAIAAALVLVGRRAMQTAPSGTERTKEMLKEDARWAKQQLAR
ncbi:MAG TPA: phage holin family protein [Actinomycetota bacterium]|nr:phage holin family protein [Actinomycetota bacterium]